MTQAATVVNGVPQATIIPRRKVIAGGLAGAVTIVVVFILNTYVTPDRPITGEVSSAITTIITFIASFLVPPGEDEHVV